MEFVVAALKIFIQLTLGNGNAGGQKLLDFAQGDLIAHELFDVLFSQTQRRQPILHKVIELIDVEARIPLESRQLSHYLSNLRRTRAQSQPLRFVPQDKQINNELDRSLILVHPSACRHCSHKVRHAKGLRQIEEPYKLLRFQHRNVSIIDARKLVLAYRAVIRRPDEVKDEWDRQNGDDDH